MNKELSQNQIELLKSLTNSPKYLHMGKSTVSAIVAGFELLSMGLVRSNDGWLHITQEGKIALGDIPGGAEERAE